ncbi:DUF4019 domain-containing protein [Croceibacterium sp. TMG7-5b_MA50]|uniref:helix-turn-helix domain-containing protein n=1 Tax=Croceibacterium sp. TMG7-5b_MA50 TaxID=3121290 RepID=UPI0032216312
MTTLARQKTLTALSEKEKETLRLIVRGHDAKSIARDLDISVHTINERLRGARRKLEVSSSREAARLLPEAESVNLPAMPKTHGHTPIAADDIRIAPDHLPASIDDAAGRADRSTRTFLGVALMIVALGLLALTTLPQTAAPTDTAATPAIVQSPRDPAIVDAALRFLQLVDTGRWNDSYEATGAAFRELNTADIWATTSERVRTPLGRVISRTFLSQENLPAPPAGYEVVKFTAQFTNSDSPSVETMTLDRENGRWYVVGVTIG